MLAAEVTKLLVASPFLLIATPFRFPHLFPEDLIQAPPPPMTGMGAPFDFGDSVWH
jgi:hypothetical protein